MMFATLFLIVSIGPICLLAEPSIENSCVGANRNAVTAQKTYDEHNRCAWIPAGHQYPAGVLGLHKEIEHFYDFMQPTRTEQELRKSVISRIESVVHQMWPTAEIKVFGSFTNGLAAPDADIDMMLLGTPEQSRLQLLKQKFLSSNIAEPNSIIIRENVRIPIIEFVDHESKINIDMKFSNDPSLNVTEVLDERKYLVFTKLMFVLKNYLKQQHLYDESSGGLSSFPLSLLCINFLQMYPDGKISEDVNFGEMLLEFSELFGQKFNYETTGFTIRNGGKYLPRNELPCSPQSLFCMERPLEPWLNAGTEAYNAPKVKEAFNNAHATLLLAMSSNSKITNGCTENGTLSHIVHTTDNFISYRNWVHDTFGHTFPSTDTCDNMANNCKNYQPN